MNLRIIALAGLVIVLTSIVPLYLYSKSLLTKIDSLEKDVKILEGNNHSLQIVIDNAKEAYEKEQELIKEYKSRLSREHRNVAKLKQQILESKESTCIDSLNSVLGRLWEQGSDTPTSSSPRSKDN